jgi:hypothetical protein
VQNLNDDECETGGMTVSNCRKEMTCMIDGTAGEAQPEIAPDREAPEANMHTAVGLIRKKRSMPSPCNSRG